MGWGCEEGRSKMGTAFICFLVCYRACVLAREKMRRRSLGSVTLQSFSLSGFGAHTYALKLPSLRLELCVFRCACVVERYTVGEQPAFGEGGWRVLGS